MQRVQSVLEKNDDQTTFRKLMQAPEIGGATRQNATQVFMSLLTCGQIGRVDLNQEFEGRQTFKDMKKGKFRNIQVTKVKEDQD